MNITIMAKTTEETQQAKQDLEHAVSKLMYQFIEDNPGYDVSLSASCTLDGLPGERVRPIYITVKATLTLL